MPLLMPIGITELHTCCEMDQTFWGCVGVKGAQFGQPKPELVMKRRARSCFCSSNLMAWEKGFGGKVRQDLILT